MSTQDDELTARMYGADNVAKYRINERDGPKEAKRRFLAKYPYAIVDKFMFGVSVDKNADISSYNVMYIIGTDPTRVVSIGSKEFLDNAEYRAALKEDVRWEPLWDVKGTLQPFGKNMGGEGFDVLKFRICVTKDGFFDSNFDPFVVDDTVVFSSNVDPNTYDAFLLAAYVATYVCGICTKHFEYDSNTPKIVTSLARYRLYFTIKRFLRSPGKMNGYLTNEMRTLVLSNRPERYEWSKEFHRGKESVSAFVSKYPRGTVRNIEPILSKYGGRVGINYEKRGVRTANGHSDDCELHVAAETNGLAKTGRLLFRRSIRSYVYCVLGAQASTRWAIVGRGAMSLQTQSVSYQKVKDTIAQDDSAVAISNMRRAIADTNVVLNLAVTLGVILVPSSMIILTEKIPGYNNVLTLATKSVRFGENDNVNRSENREDTPEVVQRNTKRSEVERKRGDKTTTRTTTTTTHSHSDPSNTRIVMGNPYAGSTVVGLGTLSAVLGVMVARYLV